MNSTEAFRRILKRLSARSAMTAASAVGKTGAGDKWIGFVFTEGGERVLQCLHEHACPDSAKTCAAALARRWAHLEAARGVKP